MTTPRSILIVGAGLAGSRCAETLRALGFDGSLTVVGEERSPPYERPALSKEFLAGDRDEDGLLLRASSFWRGRNIELVLGARVTSIDFANRTAIAHDSRTFAWDVVVLATGARARRLPMALPPGVHVLRTLDDATTLRTALEPGRRLVVIGGSFVGAEVASTARALGAEVTVVEAGPTPFAHILGQTVGRLLAARYVSSGVELRLATQAVEFKPARDGRVEAVALSDGTAVGCDAALLAVGVTPADELLPADPPGHVYACGDIAPSGGHWTSAANGAVDTARQILRLEPLPPQPSYFWSDQFGLRLQLVGDPRGAATVELDGSEDDFVARYLAADGRLLAALAANRPAEVGAFRRELAFAA